MLFDSHPVANTGATTNYFAFIFIFLLLNSHSYMSENSHLRCSLGPLYHRLTGKNSLYTDCDLISLDEGQMEAVNIDYTYKSGKRTRTHMIDYKRQCNATQYNFQSVSTKYDAMQAQIDLANDLNLPFFMVLTYLSDEYDVKMYYVIPINQFAKDFFIKYGQPVQGVYMSLFKYAQFHHTLRCKKFDPNEPIKLKDRWNESIKISDAEVFTLGELSSKTVKYPLPEMDIK